MRIYSLTLDRHRRYIFLIAGKIQATTLITGVIHELTLTPVNEKETSAIPAQICGIQIRKDAFGDIHDQPGIQRSMLNDVIEGSGIAIEDSATFAFSKRSKRKDFI